MTTEIEEVVIDAHSINPEHFLDRIAWANERRVQLALGIFRWRNSAAINLAVRSKRQLIQEEIEVRHHVFRQFLSEERMQLAARQHSLLGWHDVSRETHIA